MKKFLKEWWPLLLIAVYLIWTKIRVSSKSIAPRLIARGFEKAPNPCPLCGSTMYVKMSYSPRDLIDGTDSANLTTTCSNPKCGNCAFPYWA